MQDYLDSYVRLIERLTGENPIASARPEAIVARKPVKAEAGKLATPKRDAATSIRRVEPKRGEAEKPTGKTLRPAAARVV